MGLARFSGNVGCNAGMCAAFGLCWDFFLFSRLFASENNQSCTKRHRVLVSSVPKSDRINIVQWLKI